MRTIKQVINSYIKAVDTSLPITSPLPNQTIKQISPFIMLEHQGPNTIMPNQKIKLSNQNNFGVSRLSLLLEGSIEYEDSLKNKGILNAGDIQWLNDTSGIIRTEKVFESNINTMDINNKFN
ncbi:MAG: pirin family protein [Candidatus Sericytochromatia bacterium]